MKYLKIIKNLSKQSLHTILYRSSWVLPKYRIKGCRSFFYRDLVDFKNPLALKKPLHVYYDEIVDILKYKIEKDEKFSVIRLGDGEAYFLRKELHGNIIQRHLTENNYEIDLKEWIDAYQSNDLQTYDINKQLRGIWFPVIGKKSLENFFPLHAVYCLVATKDIFRIAKGKKIGLIGSKNKLDIIKKLMEYEEYREYLGVENFSEYIRIPETGGANNPDQLFEDIIKQSTRESDIYLVGIGIVKLKILARIRDDLDSVIIDIGSGMDAIAGIAPKDSRMFGNWINYRLENYNYHDIDILLSKKSNKTLNNYDTHEVRYI